MPPTLFTCITADPSLGRIDKASFPLETQIELLLDGIPEVKDGKSRKQKELSRWEGLSFNDENEVTEIDWKNWGFGGSLNFYWLPETLQMFSVYDSRFVQSIDWEYIPQRIRVLCLSSCGFFGTVSWIDLPEDLESFAMFGNDLSGTVELTCLPKRMQGLWIEENSFSGTICLAELPSTLQFLLLGDNELSGCIVLTHLPDGLEKLGLSKNAFSGETDFSKLPVSLTTLNVSETDLSGEIWAQKTEWDGDIGYSVEGSKVKWHK